MGTKTLKKDPYNLIITGVGGQGNVTASRIISTILMRAGYYVTIGETFGASQRGGSVMSHVRVSGKGALSPQTPLNQADFVISLEPAEAIRVLVCYGNPQTQCLTNDRPVYPVRVIAGMDQYPPMEKIKAAIDGLAARTVMVGATRAALKLGNPLFQNMIMVGAVAGMDLIPITKEAFREAIAESMPKTRIEENVGAYEIGESLVRG